MAKASRPRPSLKPIPVHRVTGCDEGWFYESGKSIKVYLYTKGIGCQTAVIRLSQIEDWIKRVKQ